jgi:hypothetical protein
VEKTLVIQELGNLLLAGKRSEGANLASQHYPFVDTLIAKRNYTRLQMCRVFLSDGFVDRYSGDQLLFPGIIRLLSIEYPEIFRFHNNWKISETHNIYWELFPTIDHVVPVARNGTDVESNMVTTSMLRNAVKSSWLIEELGWKLYPKGDMETWDGMTGCFLNLCEKNPAYTKHPYINAWNIAFIKAKKSFNFPGSD